ncbi:MAG: hypothetical protein JWM65_695 [Sphingomonas bacterium]|nr:hypothetical protein [Sphingomonas bacterium]
MKRLSLALSGMLLLAGAPCLAQAITGSPRAAQLSKVILDTETGEVQGKLKGGTLCVFPSKINLPKEKKTQDYERYDTVFSAAMKGRGFSVVTSSSDLFAGEGDKEKADFLIGAVMRPDTLNLCSSVNGEKGNITMSVDWQIYDRKAQKVVATITTTGHAVQEKFAQDGLTAMWNQAFAASLDALIDGGVVERYLGAPVPPPPGAVPAPAPAAPAAAKP